MTMTEAVRGCQKCGLHHNQKPLLEEAKPCDIFWVGLSAKKVKSESEGPLSPTTISGKLLQEIESLHPELSFYKTNLVKCLPLTAHGKLRYPFEEEIEACVWNLMAEVQALRPKIVFMLGGKVENAAAAYLGIGVNCNKDFEPDFYCDNYDGTWFVPIYHPSYITVYKRDKKGEYVEKVGRIIDKLLHYNGTMQSG